MIELNAYVRNPKAPKLFVNDVGAVYRLDGGIIEMTLIKR